MCVPQWAGTHRGAEKWGKDVKGMVKQAWEMGDKVI